MFNVLKWIKEKRKKATKLWQGTRAEQPMDSSTYATEVRTVQWNATPDSPNEMPVAISKEDTRIEVKPKDVMVEVLCKEGELDVSFDNLKDKIKAVEKRRDFMKEELNLNTAEEEKVLEWLNNRQKYAKMKERFTWQVTTQEKIDKLCVKYKVCKASIGGYQRCVPEEALNEMELYLRVHRKITQKDPTFSLIIDSGGAETRKDPIVYATSPLGNYFYVLGAWDKEVEIMDELFLRK